MRSAELELAGDAPTWIIPRGRTKNGVEHAVPLSPAAVALLARVPRIGNHGLMFTTTGETPISGYSRAKGRLDATMAAIAAEAAEADGRDPRSPVVHWTLHDLRRTVASGMARLGIDLPVIEKVLNHASGSFAGVVGVYQCHSFADEKRAALEAWARHVEAIGGRTSANVIELRAVR